MNLRTAQIRFQICPGARDGIGIDDAVWIAYRSGRQIATGRTDANGQLSFRMAANETIVLDFLGVEYNVSFHPGVRPVTRRKGQQKRLDSLGYVLGHLRSPVGNAVPDDGVDGPMTQQAIMNYQCDTRQGGTRLSIHGVLGRRTRPKLKSDVGI